MLHSLGFIPLAAAAYPEARALAKAKAGEFGFGRCRESAAAAQIGALPSHTYEL
jgi:hypothetical protein